jgi:hypothetical protein
MTGINMDELSVKFAEREGGNMPSRGDALRGTSYH